MNKELIKTYFKEFDYWLNGGSVLSINCLNTLEWTEVDCDRYWDTHQAGEYKPIFVINDEYVEFRKALTEGKTVQYRSREVLEFGAEREIWRDVNPATIHQYHISVLRIKQNEPQFKVGDWVVERNKNIPFMIKPSDLELMVQKDCLSSFKLWEPKPNEWCVFWETDVTTYTVARFHHHNKQHRAYAIDCEYGFHNIAPLEFIQTLKD